MTEYLSPAEIEEFDKTHIWEYFRSHTMTTKKCKVCGIISGYFVFGYCDDLKGGEYLKFITCNDRLLEQILK